MSLIDLYSDDSVFRVQEFNHPLTTVAQAMANDFGVSAAFIDTELSSGTALDLWMLQVAIAQLKKIGFTWFYTVLPQNISIIIYKSIWSWQMSLEFSTAWADRSAGRGQHRHSSLFKVRCVVNPQENLKADTSCFVFGGLHHTAPDEKNSKGLRFLWHVFQKRSLHQTSTIRYNRLKWSTKTWNI